MRFDLKPSFIDYNYHYYYLITILRKKNKTKLTFNIQTKKITN